MDSLPRRISSLQRQRSDSAGHTLSPSDSVTSISSYRPLLMWMFTHIRRENQDSLTKEDLRKLLGLEVDVDNEQLDEAFENLDMDGDGRVSMDEFLGGFARFLREAPTTPGHERQAEFALLRASVEPPVQLRTNGKRRGSVRRRLVDEECFESTSANGTETGHLEVNGDPTVKPSENFAQSLDTLSSNNRHSISSLWRNLSETNPELLGDFEDFVGEIAHEVEGAQRALENQRRATKQEALELDEEMESRLNAANANLKIQTALTEVKTKLKLEQRLGDKETELSAVKQKLQELSSRLESVCNFALQLESEVEAGQKAHTQLEEQYDMLTQEKEDLEHRLEAREAVLVKKHEEMEWLHRQASQRVDPSHVEESQEELLEVKREYEREISELKEKIVAYETNLSVTSDDDEMSFLSGQTPDLLSTMSSRHRHTSRNSLLDEIVKQEGIESPILRGEPLMTNPYEVPRPPWRANSLPNLFQTRQYLEPPPISFIAPPSRQKEWSSPPQGRQDPSISDENTSPGEEVRSSLQENKTLEMDLVTKPEGHLATQESHLAPMESPFSRTRSATVSGGGRPKIRARRPKKNVSGHLASDSDQTSHDSHMTSSMDSALPLTASNDSSLLAENSPVTPMASVSSAMEGGGEREDVPFRGAMEDGGEREDVPFRGAMEDGGEREDVPTTDGRRITVPSTVEDGERVKQQPLKKRDEQFIIKCQPLHFIENLATQPDYVFKILVVGNSYVGKSSYLMRLCTNAFSARYSSTIGVDFYSKALKVDDRIVSLQLWDTAGQERFQSVTKAYYRGAQGVILMYDISQEESFIAVKSWINSIQENVDQMPTGLMLIGNKQDLDDQNEREVATETGETFAKIYGAQFMETSAKTGYNVGNCLMDLVRIIKVHYEHEGPNRRQKGIQVTNKPKGSGCCGR